MAILTWKNAPENLPANYWTHLTADGLGPDVMEDNSPYRWFAELQQKGKKVVINKRTFSGAYLNIVISLEGIRISMTTTKMLTWEEHGAMVNSIFEGYAMLEVLRRMAEQEEGADSGDT